MEKIFIKGSTDVLGKVAAQKQIEADDESIQDRFISTCELLTGNQFSD